MTHKWNYSKIWLYTNTFTDVKFYENLVVTQYYEADASKEHIIRGNAAVVRCVIPSFVADFVNIVSWHTDQDESFFPGTDYGLLEIVISSDLLFITLLHHSVYLMSFCLINSNFLNSCCSILWHWCEQGICYSRQCSHSEMRNSIFHRRFCIRCFVAYR